MRYRHPKPEPEQGVARWHGSGRPAPSILLVPFRTAMCLRFPTHERHMECQAPAKLAGVLQPTEGTMGWIDNDPDDVVEMIEARPRDARQQGPHPGLVRVVPPSAGLCEPQIAKSARTCA